MPNSSVLTRGKALPPKFFERGAVPVARDLLGKVLVRRWRGRLLRAVITETEAYLGPEDRASHASRGLTPRTKVMFGPPGHWYVYFTYGLHWLLNVVTGKEGQPAAVLIRGLALPNFAEQNLGGLISVSGPARLTKKLHIDGRFNAKKAAPRTGLWIEDGGSRPKRRAIRTSPRIGVDYAGPIWAKKKLRFFLA